MRRTFHELLDHPDVDVRMPATSQSIGSLESRLATRLPPDLVDFWTISNGCTLASVDAEILGTADVLRWIGEDTPNSECPFTGLCLLPFLDDHESNPIVLALGRPLAPRVLRFPHDGDTRILYSNRETFALNLAQLLADGGTKASAYFDRVPGDYASDGPRSDQDRNDALALLAAPNRHQSWNLAVQILPATELDAWRTLLETDYSVRQDVRARMAKMSDPAVGNLLRKDEVAFNEFAHAVADAVRRAGFPVSRLNGRALQVGSQWFDLDAFFHRRNAPAAMSRIVAWMNDLQHERDPRLRAQNIFTD
jgi:hypothetical protein